MKGMVRTDTVLRLARLLKAVIDEVPGIEGIDAHTEPAISRATRMKLEELIRDLEYDTRE